tara:strand:- start:781 stop:1089 length:309 start_codon:yes stop_codon:yes gene_type:complete
MSWFIPVAAITLWPFIIVNPRYESPTLLRHERIHIVQQRELWVLGFYVIYLLDWLRHLFSGSSAQLSYRMICFEREAYAHDEDEGYLETRPAHQWKKFYWKT